MLDAPSKFDKPARTSDFPCMSTDSPVTHLTRDIEAIQIPSGLTKKLHKGTPVIITQALGGTYTVVVEHSAGLFRVLASDADALNKVHAEPAAANGTGKTDGPLNEDDVWAQLKTCYDPEIPVNIVDLGLIYAVKVNPDENSKPAFPRQRVEVDITMTSQGCPSHAMIIEQVRNRLAGVPEISQTQVNLIWEPAWTPDRISRKAREQLGIG